jgi:peptidoglycan/LPS O-acetylase OafA/YrhL
MPAHRASVRAQNLTKPILPESPQSDRHQLSQSWFRPDIAGLRVLAIIPVVAFHAGVPGFSGGYIGVDVFYVISGYLITTNLLRDAAKNGGVRLGNFWAKRVRRLLPASALMLLVSLPAAMVILSPLLWKPLSVQAGSALLYSSNFVFSTQSTDYFAADLAAPSPYLHTWSLGVEEQFYLLWPLLIILAAYVAKHAGVSARRVLLVTFVVIVAASLALAVAWTSSRPSAAFYLLPTRAWQFAAAGLLALIPSHVVGPRAMRSGMTIAGVCALGFSIHRFTPNTPFPGTAALLPVTASMLIILGGRRLSRENETWPTGLLATRPMQWLGERSYSWYLWHYPFVVLFAAGFGSHSVQLMVVASVLSLGAACLAYRFIENPIRFAPRLVGSLRRTFATAGVAILAVAVLPACAYYEGDQEIRKNPMISRARSEIPSETCEAEPTRIAGETICEAGAKDGSTTVMLIGDSHAGQWEDALAEAAKREHVRFVIRWKSSCPAIGIDTVNTAGNAITCKPYVAETLELIKQLKPTAVLISQAEAYDGRIVGPHRKKLTTDEQLVLWRKAYDEKLSEIESIVPHVGVVLDNPRLDYDPNECLAEAEAVDKSSACTSSRAHALDAISTLQTATRDVISRHDIQTIFTTTDKLCDASRCKVFDQGVPVYRDYNHLSRLWTMTQVQALQGLIRHLVAA